MNKSKALSKRTILISLVLASLPLIMFILAMMYDGASIESLKVPTYQNDELIYYYEVAGVVDYGIPQGLFGYHEQYANILSFGAWSPFLIINYCVVGSVFGWSPVNAVIYNLIFMAIAWFVFGILAEPTIGQAAWISILYITYTYVMQGIMSVSPETTCYSYLIVFIGLIYSAGRNNRKIKVILMFLISFVLTLMRPYFLGLFVASGYYLYDLKGKKSLPVTCVISCVSMYLHAFICVNFCSGSPMEARFSKIAHKIIVNTDESVRGSSPKMASALLRGLYDQFIYGLKNNYHEVKWFFTEGNTGRNFVLYILLYILLIIWIYILSRNIEGEIKKKYCCIYWFFYMTSMGIAVTLWFSGWAASRHLSQFILVILIIFAMEIDRKFLLICAEIAVLFTTIAVPNGHKDYLSKGEMAEFNRLRQNLAPEMIIEPSEGPTWDNTVLWLFADYSSGEEKQTSWQYLFAIPHGFAFNIENIYNFDEFALQDSISSRYVATIPGGNNERKCKNLGMDKIAESNGLVIYRNY